MAQAETALSRGVHPPGYHSGLLALRREMNQLFDNFLSGRFPFPGMLDGCRQTLVPDLDMSENETSIIIEAELPGLDIKDVEVTFENGILSISGEKKWEGREEKANYHLMERRHGSFHRALRLPESVDGDKVEAKFDKGVLRVMLPKKPEAVRQHRKITIETS